MNESILRFWIQKRGSVGVSLFSTKKKQMANIRFLAFKFVSRSSFKGTLKRTEPKSTNASDLCTRDQMTCAFLESEPMPFRGSHAL